MNSTPKEMPQCHGRCEQKKDVDSLKVRKVCRKSKLASPVINTESIATTVNTEDSKEPITINITESAGSTEAVINHAANDDFLRKINALFDEKLNKLEEKLTAMIHEEVAKVNETLKPLEDKLQAKMKAELSKVNDPMLMFETTFDASIKEEVAEVTDPMKIELEKLMKENKSLKAEVDLLKVRKKDEIERSEKIAKEHAERLGRAESDIRFKRLLLSLGLPVQPRKTNDVKLFSDEEKVEEMLKLMAVNDDRWKLFCKMNNPNGSFKSIVENM